LNGQTKRFCFFCLIVNDQQEVKKKEKTHDKETNFMTIDKSR